MKITVAKRLQQVEEYYFSKKLREIEMLNAQGASVINLGIGSPDLPPHPEVIDQLHVEASKSDTHAYQSYKGAKKLRDAMADWYQRIYGVSIDPATEILPLIGSKEGVVHLCMTYLEEGDEALIPDPGYPAYAAAVRLSGATARPYLLHATNGWLPDLEQLDRQDLSRVKLMWINYPHMPTGAQAPAGFFEKLVAFAKKNNILLCHDNPYSLILNDHPRSIFEAQGAKEVAVELNSLSKSSNMAGWRVGMLSGAAERLEEVLRFKSNMDSGMFLPLQLAAAKALQLDPSWYTTLNQTYAKRREHVYALLDHLNCSYDPQQVGLFVWAQIPDRYVNGYELSDEILSKNHVFITPGGIFGSGGLRYIRVSLCAKVEVLEQALLRIKG
jgi:LL-diaminopimelate aminotransferase